MKTIRQQAINNSSINRLTISLLLLSLALVLTVSFAAATDIENSTNNSSTSSPLLSDSENTSVAGPDPNVIRGGVVVYTTGSIQDAIDNAQTGDIIRLENGATFNEHDLTIPGTITSLTFDVWNAAHTGPGGTATIDGDNNQILTINQDMTVNIFNIIFRDGSTSDGGAIFNDRGILTCTGCDFIGNIATSIGGAIFNYMGVLTCSDCDFLDNIATDAAGAIYNDMGDMTFTDCDFISNSAYEGGAICNDDGTCECTYCDFTDNTVDDDGGAIYNDDGEFQCNYCAFDGNYADDEGGAIFNYYGAMDCSMCEFFDNMAYEGGAICNEDADLTCTKCDFTENTAYYGGALYNEEYGPGSTLEVNDSSFTDNEAYRDGGAIYNMAPSTFNNCDFTGNSADESGGAIQNDDDELTCNYCDFTSNEADNGGAIYNNGDILTVIGCNLVNNAAVMDGGAFYHDGDDYTLNFNRIIGNTAGDDGPDIYDGVTDEFLHDALYNWWGSNLGPTVGRIAGELVEFDPWLVMGYGANPAVITQGGTSTLTANFRYDSDGTYHDPALGHLPDDLLVTFTTTLGNVGSKTVVAYTLNGLATATLRGDEGTGVALTSASLDSETRHASITINAASVSTTAAGTIGMQETGTPVFALVLAMLLVLGGFITRRKQQ